MNRKGRSTASFEPKYEIEMVGLVIAHSHAKPGAKNPNYGIYERDYSDNLVSDLCSKLNVLDVEYRIFQRPEPNDIIGLVDNINESQVTSCISFHANAYNTKSSGSEVLYWHTSKLGKELAALLQDAQLESLGLRNRGLKEIKGGDRGDYLLRKTLMPTVIVEPFFIDNDNDWFAYVEQRETLINAYATAIKSFYS